MHAGAPEAEPVRDELLKLHYADFGPAEEAAVLAVLRSGWLTKGPRTREFEQAFAARVQAPYALGANSCTAALHLGLLAAGIGPGDEVLVPALTFSATANVVVHCGATPVFCDVLPATHVLDPASVESRLTPRTRAIIPVHFAGVPCDMSPLWALAEKHGLFILEDCAHAIETEYQGQPVGVAACQNGRARSRFAAYSFYATKNLIAGEGGMLTCADEADLRRAQVLGLHGMSADAWKRYTGEGFRLYDVVAAGFKYNMFDLQAALGLVQLAKLDTNWECRRARVEQYDALVSQAFPAGEITPLCRPAYGKSAHHLYVVRLSEELAPLRNRVIEGLLRLNVQAYVHYICLTGTQFYRERFGTAESGTPVAASLARRSITLPLFPAMSEADVEYAVAMLKRALGAAGVGG
jgi:dTDP-4-amino-4,6-dideoxygalactose transaminase